MPMSVVLSVEQSRGLSGELVVTVGHDLLDEYLTFLSGRRGQIRCWRRRST